MNPPAPRSNEPPTHLATTTNPYRDLPEKSFWKPSVAEKHMLDIGGLWNPKFPIQPKDQVVTYGSCFAQHIGKALVKKGYGWMITELAPQGMSEVNAQIFNYGIFTSRTGNIYTTSLLKQWTGWALGKTAIPGECWEQNGRFYDPFRPNIEPDGFCSAEEVRLSREEAVKSFRESIEHAHYFVFTLGLTESWKNKRAGYEYPMCPGTVAGEFDPEIHVFENQQFESIKANLLDSMGLMRSVNPKLKFILTVSPVPLTATMSPEHVLVATMLSKSILRAVAGQLAADHAYVDYFPSYEIINSPVFKGGFFEPNQRSVSKHGVKFVMDSFFDCLVRKYGEALELKRRRKKGKGRGGEAGPGQAADVACEEELLGAFQSKP